MRDQGVNKNDESTIGMKMCASSDFSDAECELQATDMLGGTGEGLVTLGCLHDLTQKRTADLKEFFGEK